MPETLTHTKSGIKIIDVIDPSNAEIIALSKNYNLNHFIVQDSLQPEHLPKYEFVEDVHFMLLRYNIISSDAKASTIQELTDKLTIFYADDFVITIHKAKSDFLQKIFAGYKSLTRLVTTTEIIARILWQVLETFDDRATKLSVVVDNNEEQIMKGKIEKGQLGELYMVKREAALAHKLLVLMQEPINHVYPTADLEPLVQDVRDQLLKMKTLYGQLLDEVNTLMNLYISFSAQKTNDVVKVLTIFSVFFMPLTFIVGVYGMNFEFMPELKEQWGYPAVLLLMVIVTIFIYIWFKRKKWL